MGGAFFSDAPPTSFHKFKDNKFENLQRKKNFRNHPLFFFFTLSSCTFAVFYWLKIRLDWKLHDAEFHDLCMYLFCRWTATPKRWLPTETPKKTTMPTKTRLKMPKTRKKAKRTLMRPLRTLKRAPLLRKRRLLPKTRSKRGYPSERSTSWRGRKKKTVTILRLT